eukprot:scaffold12482_cov179-Skeletonema_marinoi.AAC.3
MQSGEVGMFEHDTPQQGALLVESTRPILETVLVESHGKGTEAVLVESHGEGKAEGNAEGEVEMTCLGEKEGEPKKTNTRTVARARQRKRRRERRRARRALLRAKRDDPHFGLGNYVRSETKPKSSRKYRHEGWKRVKETIKYIDHCKAEDTIVAELLVCDALTKDFVTSIDSVISNTQ